MGKRARRRKSSHRNEDRISKLPNSIIDSILARLPIRDAVRTSRISRSWRYKWISIPNLVFDDRDHACSNGFVQCVDHVLSLHRGSVNRFELISDLESWDFFDKWMLVLSRKEIKEVLLGFCSTRELYTLPSCFFSCEKITFLDLYGCSFIPSASFQGFHNLRKLYLDNVSFTTGGLELLIFDCPLLGKLILKDIIGCSYLRIRAPNLVSLIVESPLDLYFEHTPLLVFASIRYERKRLCMRKVFKDLRSLPTLQNLELCQRTVELLAYGVFPANYPTTWQLKSLHIDVNFGFKNEILGVFCLFRSSPLLENLHIKVVTPYKERSKTKKDLLEGEEDLGCMFSSLKTVKLTEITGSNYEMQFIEYLLSNTPVIERVHVELKQGEENVHDILNVMLHSQMCSPLLQYLGLKVLSRRDSATIAMKLAEGRSDSNCLIKFIKTLEVDDFMGIAFKKCIDLLLADSCGSERVQIELKQDEEKFFDILNDLLHSQRCSLLQYLDLKVISQNNSSRISMTFWSGQGDSNCLLESIKTIEVYSFMGNIYEMTFIEFLLGNAPVLESVQIELKQDEEEFFDTLNVLLHSQRCSLLQYLDLKVLSQNKSSRISMTFWLGQGYSNCLLESIKTIEVYSLKGNFYEMAFIRFLLGNAPVLERVQIEVKQEGHEVVPIFMDLLRFRRCSPKVEVLIS